MSTEFHDPADLPQASAHDHPIDHALEALCPHCQHPVDAVCPDCGAMVEMSGSGANGAPLTQAEFYRRFVLMLQSSRNAKFTLCCYLIATGDAFADGVSMTEVGRKWGVTKATVSKYCRFITGYLGIEPSRYMRKEELAQKFRLSNRRPVKT